MRSIFFVCTLLISISYITQAQSLDWAQRIGYSDYVTDMDYNATLDVLHVSVVTTLPSVGRSDGLLQLNATGDTIWEHTFPEFTSIHAITTNQQGQVYITGVLRGLVDFNLSPHPADTFFLGNNTMLFQPSIYVMKLDTNGAFLWAVEKSDSFDLQAYDMLLDDQENIYLSGNKMRYRQAQNALDVYHFVQKMDTQGGVVWEYVFKNNAGGTASPDNQLALHNNQLYLAGQYKGTVDMNADPTATFILSTNSTSDGYLLSIDTSGNFLWAHAYGSQIIDGYNAALAVDGQGYVYTAGRYHWNDPATNNLALRKYLYKFSSQGQVLLDTTLEQDILAIDVSQPSYLYTTGKKKFPNYYGSEDDIVVNKWQTNDFSQVWQYRITSYIENDDKGTEIVTTSTGKVYVAGDFEYILYTMPNGVLQNLYGSGQSTGFLLQINPQMIAIPYLQTLEGVDCFPNPTTDLVTVNLKQPLEDATITMMSIDGRALSQQPLIDDHHQLDLSTYPSGTYLLRISSQKKVATLKVIKQ